MMATLCPRCSAPAQTDARFCDECGARLSVEAPISAPAHPLADLPPPPGLDPISSDPEQLGSELIVEVETNRPMVHGHALMLRFRVTSNLRTPCGVTLHMKLHGQGRLIDQDETDQEQQCQLHRRGDQHVFSFPFLSLRPGHIVVQELSVVVTPLDRPRDTITYELPDRSLFVLVSDPNLAAGSPGVVISGGIHIDFSKLEEVYGSDIKSLLNLNAARGGAGATGHRLAANRLAPASGLSFAGRASTCAARRGRTGASPHSRRRVPDGEP